MMKRMMLAMAVLALSSVAQAADGVPWLGLKAGYAKAKQEKKPLLVDYYFGKGCPRCEKLDEEEYAKPEIIKKITDDFIPVRVDLTKKLTEEEEQLGEKYDYKKDCLLLFLDSEGNILKDTEGKHLMCATMIDPEQFIQYLDKVKKALASKAKQ